MKAFSGPRLCRSEERINTTEIQDERGFDGIRDDLDRPREDSLQHAPVGVARALEMIGGDTGEDRL